ncbi:hypothetical protein GCM10007973_08560 [Polymorphobacter multimanifer]|nr:hypothetical protein GCM10007973_08560 [Polymorphobacter multimanifer]
MEIVRLDAEADPLDVGGLLVTLDYRIRATGETARLDLAIALDGGGGA